MVYPLLCSLLKDVYKRQVVDDLSAYGFNVQKSKKSVTITSGTNGYYFDESFSPNTESSTMGTGSVKTSTIKGKVADQMCIRDSI